MNDDIKFDENLPKHVAIILDGNGRWAKRQNKPRFYGHRMGAINIKDIAQYADKIGIKFLTVFCFSTENWKRPKAEVDYLMNTPVKYFNKYKDRINKSNIRVCVIGRRDRLSKELLECIDEVEEGTRNHTGLRLNLCVDYGSLDEISNGIKNICNDVVNHNLKISDINDNTIKDYLYTCDLPDVDLLIRTSGEIRLSNFLLIQIAYAELYFTNVCWPDFDNDEFLKAIENYKSRNRRFGGLKEKKK